MGFQFRNIIILRLFKKLLKLKSSLVEQGHLVNMIENDTQKFVDLCVYWPYTIFGPLELTVSVYFVVNFVGPYAALTGIGVILMLIPIQFLLSRQTGILRQKALVSSDKIVQTVSQIVQGIVTIKYNAWEPAFLSLVKSCRMHKYSNLLSSGYFKVINEAMFPLSPSN
jgi:ABC-type multidrug transport system fused ATPase/permease subunit